jgi:hypothetical protein
MIKGEINNDFYCSIATEGVRCTDCYFSEREECKKNITVPCPHKHRKYPTPEQYKEEYGGEWEGAVYTACSGSNCTVKSCIENWTASKSINQAITKMCAGAEIIFICACTPWGKPPDGWRPEGAGL